MSRESWTSVAIGGDDFESADGGGEVAVVDAGAVGGGGDGSGDGDVRERGEIVEGEAAGIDNGGELAVAYAGADGDGAGLIVDVDLVEVLEGDLVLGAVGDAVEGVARAERAELVAAFDDGADFVGVGGREHVVSAVGDVACPVLTGSGLLLGGGKPRNHAAGHDGSRCFEEVALVHGLD